MRRDPEAGFLSGAPAPGRVVTGRGQCCRGARPRAAWACDHRNVGDQISGRLVPLLASRGAGHERSTRIAVASAIGAVGGSAGLSRYVHPLLGAQRDDPQGRPARRKGLAEPDRMSVHAARPRAIRGGSPVAGTARMRTAPRGWVGAVRHRLTLQSAYHRADRPEQRGDRAGPEFVLRYRTPVLHQRLRVCPVRCGDRRGAGLARQTGGDACVRTCCPAPPPHGSRCLFPAPYLAGERQPYRPGRRLQEDRDEFRFGDRSR